MRVHIILYSLFVIVIFAGCDSRAKPAQMILGLQSYMNMDSSQQVLSRRKLKINVIEQGGDSTGSEENPVEETRITGFSNDSRTDVFATFYRKQLMRVWVHAKDIESIPDIIKKDLHELGISKIELNHSADYGQLMVSIKRARDGYVDLLVEDKLLAEVYWEEVAR